MFVVKLKDILIGAIGAVGAACLVQLIAATDWYATERLMSVIALTADVALAVVVLIGLRLLSTARKAALVSYAATTVVLAVVSVLLGGGLLSTVTSWPFFQLYLWPPPVIGLSHGSLNPMAITLALFAGWRGFVSSRASEKPSRDGRSWDTADVEQ